MRDYLDNRWHGVAAGAKDFVQVPTAVAVFANHFVPEGDPPHGSGASSAVEACSPSQASASSQDHCRSDTSSCQAWWPR
jgi:hypothetical protein